MHFAGHSFSQSLTRNVTFERERRFYFVQNKQLSPVGCDRFGAPIRSRGQHIALRLQQAIVSLAERIGKAVVL
jgi:hypothetical protein